MEKHAGEVLVESTEARAPPVKVRLPERGSHCEARPAATGRASEERADPLSLNSKIGLVPLAEVAQLAWWFRFTTTVGRGRRPGD